MRHPRPAARASVPSWLLAEDMDLMALLAVLRPEYVGIVEKWTMTGMPEMDCWENGRLFADFLKIHSD